MLYNLCVLLHFTIPQNRYYHFTDEKTEVQRLSGQSQADSTPVSFPVHPTAFIRGAKQVRRKTKPKGSKLNVSTFGGISKSINTSSLAGAWTFLSFSFQTEAKPRPCPTRDVTGGSGQGGTPAESVCTQGFIFMSLLEEPGELGGFLKDH